jgi:hypothetical protein
MDPESEASAAPVDAGRTQQVDNAIRAIQERKPVPEIDFTIHTMEDGTQVNTMERVCKGVCFPLPLANYPTIIIDTPQNRAACQPVIITTNHCH